MHIYVTSQTKYKKWRESAWKLIFHYLPVNKTFLCSKSTIWTDHDETSDDVFGFSADIGELFNVVVASESVTLHLVLVPGVEGAVAARDQHEHDHPDAPHVGGRARHRALHHLRRDELRCPAHVDRNTVLAVESPSKSEIYNFNSWIIIFPGDTNNIVGLQI